MRRRISIFVKHFHWLFDNTHSSVSVWCSINAATIEQNSGKLFYDFSSFILLNSIIAFNYIHFSFRRLVREKWWLFMTSPWLSQISVHCHLFPLKSFLIFFFEPNQLYFPIRTSFDLKFTENLSFTLKRNNLISNRIYSS